MALFLSSTRLASLFFCIASVFCMQLDLPARQTLCLNDQLPSDTLTVIRYGIVAEKGAKSDISLSVRDPNDRYIQTDSNIDMTSKAVHQFEFTTKVPGTYFVCYHSNSLLDERVLLEFKHGVDAKDYSDVARKEHLLPVEEELRKMEDLVGEIHHEMLSMREREAAMRNTNESTNSKILWFSFFSILILMAMGAWQIVYLRNFFRSKKII